MMKAQLSRNTIRFGAAALALAFAACSSPGYILHWRSQPSRFKPFSGGKENAAIPAVLGTALLYDREPLVFFEGRQDDGSVWVHYPIVLKNASSVPVRFDARKVHIEALDVPTEVEKKDDAPPVAATGADAIRLSQAADEAPPAEKGAEKAPEKPKKKVETEIVLQTKKAFAVYQDEKPEGDQPTVGAGKYYKLRASFQIPKEAVMKYAGSSLPVSLVVPIVGAAQPLKLDLWLWKQ